MRGYFDMGNDGNSKEGTMASGIFSISFDDESGNPPGVTQLLNPKLMAAKEAARKAKEAANAPKVETKVASPEPSFEIEINNEPTPNISSPTPAPTAAKATAPASSAAGTNQSLKDLGVHFELQFESERGSYRYTRVKPHGKSGFEMWQEKFFYQMKLDLRTLEVQGTFQEFAKGKHTFQEDAFALTDSSFVQIVRLDGDTQKIYVLLSSQSLMSKKDAVLQALSGKTAGGAGSGDKSSGGDDFKIELAS